jgi:hypothetical protein
VTITSPARFSWMMRIRLGFGFIIRMLFDSPFFYLRAKLSGARVGPWKNP